VAEIERYWHGDGNIHLKEGFESGDGISLTPHRRQPGAFPSLVKNGRRFDALSLAVCAKDSPWMCCMRIILRKLGL